MPKTPKLPKPLNPTPLKTLNPGLQLELLEGAPEVESPRATHVGGQEHSEDNVSLEERLGLRV